MGEKKLRVADVARDLGVHRNTITLLYDETATRIDLDTMNKLCNYLGCNVDDLLEFIPDIKS
jgi:putative transcriptional regulator